MMALFCSRVIIMIILQLSGMSAPLADKIQFGHLIAIIGTESELARKRYGGQKAGELPEDLSLFPLIILSAV